MSGSGRVLRVGTRQSQLARLQTDMVIESLKNKASDLSFEIVAIKTAGDKVLDKPIADLGSSGVFVKELEDALLANEVDFVVHSLKDMPVDVPDGLKLVATLRREDPRDVLVSNHGTLEELPQNSRVATSSRRRSAQLTHLRKDLRFVEIRGNVPTRLRKLDEGECEAMVLAAAGLLRLHLSARIAQYFQPQVCTPAAGQGALAIEARLDAPETIALLADINDDQVSAQVTAERAFLKHLGGGCSVPIGAYAEIAEGKLSLIGCITDGDRLLRASLTCQRLDQAEKLGAQLADEMLQGGGREILSSIMRRPQSPISPP